MFNSVFYTSTIKKGKQSEKSDIGKLSPFKEKSYTRKSFPWGGFLYMKAVVRGHFLRQRPLL